MKLLLLFFLLTAKQLSAQLICTYAGVGTMGYSGDGGPASVAELSKPIGLYIDENDNLFVCGHSVIRKVNLNTGIITSIAGASTSSLGDGGPATAALVNDPRSICADRAGNLYIADYWACTIRRIDKSTQIINSCVGVLSNPGYSGDGGPAISAKINSVFAICIDTVSNFLYLTDTYNFRIRKVNLTTGNISTIAGTGTTGYSGDGGLATSAQISRAIGICLDKYGNVYLGDWDNSRVRKIDITTNVISTFIGNGISGYDGDGGPALAARISQPSGMCFDSCGNFYFSDGGIGGGNYRIRKVDAETRVISTIAGNGTQGYSGDGGLATTAQFSRTNGICLDKKGNLYVADIDNHRVRKIKSEEASCYSISSINDFALSDQLLIYPNPVGESFIINANYEIQKVEVINSIGQVVKLLKLQLISKEQEVNTSSLSPGLYIVRVNDTWMGKFLKE